MPDDYSHTDPLISIIIPCYNHGHFIRKAIESVLHQSYTNIELIVIDDGSTDDTSKIAKAFPKVFYHYQENSGLAASRNKGIAISTGTYLVFLDADDWLFEDALKINLSYLQKNEAVAFVSGGYEKVLEPENIIINECRKIESHHYENLLKHGNFITVPAAVMYRKWVFDEFQFDESLKVCEDYDLYLKVSRKYPVLHHTDKVAAYRRHASNMSSNDKLMLKVALEVLNKQKPFLKSKDEFEALNKGRNKWKSYYCNEIFKKLKSGHLKPSFKHFVTLFQYKPKYLIKYLIR